MKGGGKEVMRMGNNVDLGPFKKLTRVWQERRRIETKGDSEGVAHIAAMLAVLSLSLS